jgi:DNA helicase-2/ATP-dependent DNA helicase PcrA
VVTRLKKHPAMLRAIDEHVGRWEAALDAQIQQALGPRQVSPAAEAVYQSWSRSASRPLAHRLHALATGVRAQGDDLPIGARVVLERLSRDQLRQARDITGGWAEILTDRARLGDLVDRHAPGVLSVFELDRAHAWCVARCSAIITATEEPTEASDRDSDYGARSPMSESLDINGENGPSQGIDGRALDEAIGLDREDDSLLLRLVQRQLGPLMRGTKGKEALVYEHVFVDEAQDLSPVDLAVVLDTVSKARCVTLAGDVAQRLHMDNGFTDWRSVLSDLGMAGFEIEPLRISYRSTLPIMAFARHVLGPLATEPEQHATRSGVPVELFSFGHSGDAVGFLTEQLRELMHSEPRASVAVIARYPEQADIYYAGLKNGDVPALRRVADQDFPFTPGVDVTDVRQVKGLEFDYVILVEVTASTYPADDETRHLLYIAATRAAHQLWVLATGTASRLLPDDLEHGDGPA